MNPFHPVSRTWLANAASPAQRYQGGDRSRRSWRHGRSSPRLVISGLVAWAALTLATPGHATSADRVAVPAGVYQPLFRTARDPATISVAAFLLDEHPVTNAEFLAFVTAHPKWRRSQVSRLFADSSYLTHWQGDLELGPSAPPFAPVVRVSWFAARAFAASRGQRLPSTSEWEFAASAGYRSLDGKNDPELKRDLYAWLARPVPSPLPDISTARVNHFGLRGLHGLVWEWVEDFSTALVTGESRGDSGLERDLFCGSGALGAKDTSDYAAFMRQALRSSLRANNTTSSLGFRCARDLVPVPPSSPSP